MTQNLSAPLKDLTILADDTASRWCTTEEYGDADVIMLYGPAALDAIAFTIEVASTIVSQVAKTLQAGDTPADVAPPGAGKAQAYFDLPTAGSFRIKAASAVAADRTWQATKQFKG